MGDRGNLSGANIGAYVQCQRDRIFRKVSQELSQSQRYTHNLRPVLLAEKNYTKAREQFQQLLAENPDNADVAVAVALLSLELRDYDVAESNFKKALDLDYRDPGMVRFYLGGIYEKTNILIQAMEWYRSVTSGNQYIPAQIRYASC